MDLIKKINSYKHYDVDWSTIYASKILEDFEKDCKTYKLIDVFFENIDKFDSRTKENMYNLISFSNEITNILPYLDMLKVQLTCYTEVSEIDALLGLFESINIEHTTPLSFLKDYELKPYWIADYALSISRY